MSAGALRGIVHADAGDLVHAPGAGAKAPELAGQVARPVAIGPLDLEPAGIALRDHERLERIPAAHRKTPLTRLARLEGAERGLEGWMVGRTRLELVTP